MLCRNRIPSTQSWATRQTRQFASLTSIALVDKLRGGIERGVEVRRLGFDDRFNGLAVLDVKEVAFVDARGHNGRFLQGSLVYHCCDARGRKTRALEEPA